MSAISEIQKVIYKAVQDGAFGLDVAYPNDTFDPTGSAGYLGLFLLRAPTVQAELGSEGCDLHTGLIQIDINYPQGKGDTLHAEMSDTINAWFRSGATFAGAAESVNIRNVSAGPLQIGQGWATLPLTIEYFAFSGRVN